MITALTSKQIEDVIAHAHYWRCGKEEIRGDLRVAFAGGAISEMALGWSAEIIVAQRCRANDILAAWIINTRYYDLRR